MKTANWGPYHIYDTNDEISKGNVEGSNTLTMGGDNPDMQADVTEDLWPPGGELVYMPTPDTITFASAEGGDTQTLVVSGCLAGVTVTDTIVLNGTTPVVGTQLFDVLNFAFLTVGATNTGTITGTATTHGTPQIGLIAGRGISQHGFYRVPADCNVIIKQIEIDAAKAAGGQDPLVTVNLFVRFTPTSPWISILNRRIDTAVQNDIIVPFPLSDIIEAGADIRFSAVSSQSSTEVNARLTGICYEV